MLSHFTNGPDARRLNDLLQTSQPIAATSSSGGGSNAAAAAAAAAGGPQAAAAAAGGVGGGPRPVRQGPLQPSPAAVAAVAAAAPLAGGPPGAAAGGGGSGTQGVPAYALQALRLESSSLSERVQKTALLAPLVGIFLALWDSYLAATAAAVPALGPAAAAAAALEGEVSAAAVAAGGSSGGSSGQGVVLQELAEMADDRFMSSLRFLQVRVCCGCGVGALSGVWRGWGLSVHTSCRSLIVCPLSLNQCL